MRFWQLGFLFLLLGQRSWLRSQCFYDKERGLNSPDSFIKVFLALIGFSQQLLHSHGS